MSSSPKLSAAAIAGVKVNSPFNKVKSTEDKKNDFSFGNSVEKKVSTPHHVKIKHRLSSIKKKATYEKKFTLLTSNRNVNVVEDGQVSLREKFLSIILNEKLSDDAKGENVNGVLREELTKRLEWRSKSGIHIHSPRASDTDQNATIAGFKNLKPINISKGVKKARQAIKEKNREEAEAWLVDQLCKKDYITVHNNKARITGSVFHVSVALCNIYLIKKILEPFRYQRRKLCNLKDEKGQSPLFYLWDTTSCSKDLQEYIRTYKKFNKNELLKKRLDITLELVRFGATLADFDFKNLNIFHRLVNQERRHDVEALFQTLTTLFVNGGVDSLRNRAVKVSKLVYSNFQKKLNRKKFIWKEFPYVAIGKVTGESFRNGKAMIHVTYYLPAKRRDNTEAILNRHEQLIPANKMVYLDSSKVPETVKQSLQHEKADGSIAEDIYAKAVVGTCRIYYIDNSNLNYSMSFPMTPIKIEYVQNPKEKSLENQKVVDVYFHAKLNNNDKDEYENQFVNTILKLPDYFDDPADQDLLHKTLNRIEESQKTDETKLSSDALRLWSKIRKRTESNAFSTLVSGRVKIEQTVEACVRNVINMCNLYPCNKMLILKSISSEIDAKECFQAMQKYCLSIKKSEIGTRFSLLPEKESMGKKLNSSDDFKFNTLKGRDKQGRSITKTKEVELKTIDSSLNMVEDKETITYAKYFWYLEDNEIVDIKKFALGNKMPLWRLLDLYGMLKRFHGSAAIGFTEEFLLFQKKCDFELACDCWAKYFEEERSRKSLNMHEEQRYQLILNVLLHDSEWASTIDFMYHKDDGIAMEQSYKYERRSVYENAALLQKAKKKKQVSLKRGAHVFLNRKKQLYQLLEKKLGSSSFSSIKDIVSKEIVKSHLNSTNDGKFARFSQYIVKLFSRGPHRMGNERNVYIALFIPGLSKEDKEKYLYTDFHSCIKTFQEHGSSFVSTISLLSILHLNIIF